MRSRGRWAGGRERSRRCSAGDSRPSGDGSRRLTWRYPNEAGRRLPLRMTKLTPEDADRIFAATAAGSDPLVAFVTDMRQTYSRAPDASTQARHLRAMAEEFTTRPAAAPARNRRLPVGRAVAAALVGSLLVAGSALAATGHLPGPAQNAVSDAAKVVGLTLPAPHATGQSHGDAGKARADANKARAKAFTDAKKSWTECVAS